MNVTTSISPPLQVSQWLNSLKPISLEGLQGRVVVLHTFQMLCPGCVSHGLPQALRIHRLFPQDKVRVIGLHTVFEHHDVMGHQALRVFLDEYRIPFPVGIDKADPASPVPLTMRAYGLRGTPSVVIFGQIDDLQLGVVIGQLLAESSLNATVDAAASAIACNSLSACSDGACSLQA